MSTEDPAKSPDSGTISAEDLSATALLVERGDPDRFLSAMAAPPAARAWLFPLYAFNLEIARAPWATQEPMIAEMRLQFWRDVVAEIVAGKPPRAHEVAAPLAEVVRTANISPATLTRMIDARRADLEVKPFADAEALSTYLDDSSGGLMWATAQALGEDPSSEARVRDIGWAMGLASWFRAVPELEARGRMPLPDPRSDALRELAENGLARLRAARKGRYRAIPALRASWLAEPVLSQVRADPGRVAAGDLALSEFRRRGSLLWRAITGRW